MFPYTFFHLQIKLDRVDRISKTGRELVNKGYQLQGCLSNLNLTGQNRRDSEYLRQTLQEIRALGSEVKQLADDLRPEIGRIMKYSNENEEKLKKRTE